MDNLPGMGFMQDNSSICEVEEDSESPFDSEDDME